jgi:serine/threonine protein kinase/sugar lactone lactonase YvrE
MAHLEGTRLGAYEIIERIGSGGMAEVYRAKQRTAFDREVAIKVIRKGYADDEDFRARFLREARAISQLSHLNILPLIEFGESGENGEILFLVMPYISGGTLRDRIKKQGGPLPLRDTGRIFTQLCEAIEHAHQHGLIHRDIKPSNVLLQDGRNVLLADFGIALDTGDARLTSTGMGLGTAEYMAPEQAKGQADRRSDIYSLGVVLYVMLTGQAPYSGSTPFDVLLKHATEPLPALTALNPDVPPSIEAVVQTAMAKLPNDRFQSVGAMINAFENALLQIGPQAMAAMQWSGSVPAIRPPGGTSAPGISSPQSRPSTSNPSTPGSGPQSGPSQTPSPGQVSGSQPSLEDLPTLRRGLSDGSGQSIQPAASTPLGRTTDPELPTVIPGEATGATRLESTRMAPPAPPANWPSAPSGSMPPAAGNVPEAPPTAPPSPPARKQNKTLVAVLVAIVIVVLGGSALGAGLFLNGKKQQTGTATQMPGSTVATPGPLTFIPGTACSQKAANPTEPAKTPTDYLAPIPSAQGVGSPAFIAVHYDGSVYYTDQAGQGIFSYSSAISGHPRGISFPNLGPVSGVAITSNQATRIFYLQQGQDTSGKPIERLMTVNSSGVSTLLASVPGGNSNGLPGFALSLNPVNNALLVPDGANSTLYCYDQSTLKATPVVTGLQRPVAAVVDSAGNIYVADQGANKIMRFSPTGSKPEWSASYTAPADLVIDQDGYLLATLQGAALGDGQVVRIDPTTGAMQKALMNGLQQPRGITLDISQYRTGTIYFTDQAANGIYAMCTSHNAICP